MLTAESWLNVRPLLDDELLNAWLDLGPLFPIPVAGEPIYTGGPPYPYHYVHREPADWLQHVWHPNVKGDPDDPRRGVRQAKRKARIRTGSKMKIVQGGFAEAVTLYQRQREDDELLLLEVL